MERIVKKVEFQMPTQAKATRVAAYARVSSDKDAMLHSLSAQVSQYSNLIQNHTGWLYSGVYADEALTGTKDNRAEFLRLMEDCKAGKIDMIITKSISRFARNTVTLLQAVRELKTLGVDVYFEEQNIHTMSADGELMLSILASYAQEESLSASENQKWRIKHNFENGIPWHTRMFGYHLVDEHFEIIPEEAAIVREIFSDYLSGMGMTTICKKLNAANVLSPGGMRWREPTIAKMLRNYTYTGNLLLQKTFRENHLTKKKLPNRGELPQYHVANTHEAIIPQSIFDAVQTEITVRAAKHAPRKEAKIYPFSALLVCDNCGKHYRRKSTTTGPVWICTTYNTNGKSACASKQIPEATLIAVTEDVLGIKVDNGLNTIVSYIRVQNGNKLTFCLRNGTTKAVVWKDRSRSESWMPEMRKAAGEQTRRRKEKCQDK